MIPVETSPSRLAISRRGLILAGAATALSPALPSPAAADEALAAFVTDTMTRAGVAGMAVGYARDGVVRLAEGYGLADVESGRRVTGQTVFHVASLTKPVIATAVMMLAEAGLLDVDEPVAPHLDFAIGNPVHPGVDITFRHLMAHVSSISDKTCYAVDFRQPGRDAVMPLDTFLRDYLTPGGAHYSAEGSYSPAAPGARWDYSNVGYALLGHAAGRVAGQDLRHFIDERLFAPLGMRRVSWSIAGTPADAAVPYDSVDGVRTRVQPVGFPDWPGGMLRASVMDYTRFLAAATNGGVWGDARILTGADLEQMMAPTTPPGLPAWLTGQGLGWQRSKLDGVDLVEHWGGDPGVCNAAYLDPARRTAVAVFTNASGSREVMTAVKAVAGRLMSRDTP
ncbi:serine hydrolase domain-containing protein [Brevundimonas sp.]|uniref:serine hydrolase domain-containing protein n=1 Tax=Brevundimonas sp. TaxID=1871086 RepID=UPI002D3CA78D|nr:serine hydrolase domain-containing protein [Brevundimonas sp.]HYC99196.1 serine hydrolase domain-containing protein [Brevundimonas sp.]